MSKIVRYAGKTAEVSWDKRLCIHVGECGRAKGDLFVGGRDPWCEPDRVDDAAVQEVVTRCPTGALFLQRGEGAEAEKPASENSVMVSYNGPLFLKGDLDIESAPEDAPGIRFRAALCRCGASKNKPFCDNSHEKAGFKDYGAVGETGKKISATGGTLSVKPAKDGPLLLKGNMKLLSSSGRQAWQGDQVALCRCGGSQNKPFCDGQHKKIGFSSD